MIGLLYSTKQGILMTLKRAHRFYKENGYSHNAQFFEAPEPQPRAGAFYQDQQSYIVETKKSVCLDAIKAILQGHRIAYQEIAVKSAPDLCCLVIDKKAFDSLDRGTDGCFDGLTYTQAFGQAQAEIDQNCDVRDELVATYTAECTTDLLKFSSATYPGSTTANRFGSFAAIYFSTTDAVLASELITIANKYPDLTFQHHMIQDSFHGSFSVNPQHLVTLGNALQEMTFAAKKRADFLKQAHDVAQCVRTYIDTLKKITDDKIARKLLLKLYKVNDVLIQPQKLTTQTFQETLQNIMQAFANAKDALPQNAFTRFFSDNHTTLKSQVLNAYLHDQVIANVTANCNVILNRPFAAAVRVIPYPAVQYAIPIFYEAAKTSHETATPTTRALA